MAFSDILNHITAEGKKAEDAVIRDARANADKIIAAAKQEAETLRSKTKKEASRTAEQIRNREVIAARLKGRMMKLSEKGKILDQVYKEVEKRLRAGSKERRELLKQMIISCIQTGEEEVFVGESDIDVVDRKTVKEINNLIKKNLPKHEIRLSPGPDGLEGIIITRGKVAFNNSWANIMRDIRERTLDETAKILFS